MFKNNVHVDIFYLSQKKHFFLVLAEIKNILKSLQFYVIRRGLIFSYSVFFTRLLKRSVIFFVFVCSYLKLPKWFDHFGLQYVVRFVFESKLNFAVGVWASHLVHLVNVYKS